MPYDCGHPTNEEQYMLELINQARANPAAYGQLLSTTTDPNVSSEFTYWDQQDAQEPTRAQIRSDFAAYPAVPPVAMSPKLLAAAHAHDEDMYQNDYQGHTGTDNSTPQSRCNAQGYPGTYIGENIFAYGKSVFESVANWLIDFGPGNDTAHGHRKNILDLWGFGEYYAEAGPGIIDGSNGSVGPMICTLDLGNAGQNFILGVVYSDNNHNGAYDMGEGDSGVKVTVSGGSYYAISSGSGGYAIPYSGTGSVTVTASGGAFPTPVIKTIDFQGENVKVDFNPDLTGYPSQAVLVLPETEGMVNYDSATFVWNSVPLAASYHIEIGTDSLLKQKLLVSDSGLKDTTLKYGMLKDSTTYYWRVQAKNAKGLGPWSAIAPFSTSFAPSAVALIAPANNSTLADSAVIFVWRMADKGGMNYALEIASNKTMTNSIWGDTLSFDATDTSATAPATLFIPGSTYYWTVLAQNNNGWSKFGTPRSFTISSASVNTPKQDTISMTLSPNPTTGIIHVHYKLGLQEDVSFRLFNSVGQSVKSVGLGMRPAGENEYDFDESSLPPGTYSMELWVEGRLELGRVVIER